MADHDEGDVAPQDDPHRYNRYLDELRVHPVATTVHCDRFTCATGDQLFYRTWPAHEARTTADNMPERVLVGVHGMAAHGELYVQVADQLVESGSTVIAPDLKHHGRSDGEKGDIVSFRELVDQLREFIIWVRKIYAGSPLFLMGNSLGGCLCTNYTAMYGGRVESAVDGLVLMGPALYRHNHLSATDTLLLPLLLLAYLLAPGRPVIDVERREAATMANPLRKRYDETDPYRLNEVTPRYLVEANRWIKRAYRSAPAITVPVLIIFGERDALFDRDDMAAFFASIPHDEKRLVMLQEAYHCLYSDPAMVKDGGWAVLRKWLEDAT